MQWIDIIFNQDFPLQTTIHTHQTACGMPLLMLENHEVAVVTADAWVRTGAADEPPELAGVSHFLEHMLFKGTEKYGLGEIERAIESVGGVCNAGTSHDFTHYYVTLPTAAAGQGIDMLAEILRHSMLDPDELEKERGVILEEYRRKQDHPAGVLFERLYEDLFESGPYHMSVIGTEETIQAIDRPRMIDYYRRRYGPQNIALVVTGDFRPDEVIERTEAALDGFDRPAGTLRVAEPSVRGDGKSIFIPKPTGGEIYVAFAFGASGMDRTERILPLDMAQFILGQGRASILYQQLKEKQKLCSSIGTHYATHHHDSLFVAVATCLPEQLDALRKGLVDELERFAAEPPPEAQMTRARRLLSSAHRFGMETTGGAATNIGYYYTLTGGNAFLEQYLERNEQVTADQVREATVETVRPGAVVETMVEISVGPEQK